MDVPDMFGHLKGEPSTEKDVIPGRGFIPAKNIWMPNSLNIGGHLTHSGTVTKHAHESKEHSVYFSSPNKKKKAESQCSQWKNTVSMLSSFSFLCFLCFWWSQAVSGCAG